MGRTSRTKKAPITRTDHARSGKSSIATQATISRFHTLLKRQAQLKSQIESSSSSKCVHELAHVEREMEDLGGLAAYQTASILGQGEQRGGDTSKILVKWLKEMNVRPTKGSKLKSVGYEAFSGMICIAKGCVANCRMLEIGALSPCNYAATMPWVFNTPIDLNSQHPDILQQDFLDRPLPTSEDENFDIVSCSLVLNFVPEPQNRGLS